VAVNCAAIPGTLIESELFGYAEGAFTGASRRGFRGKVIQASGGTLFLDEIGDMPLEAQTRLLRVIAEGEVCPLGSDRLVPVDLQVVCASHQDLEALVEKGGFRADLLYRLSGATVVMPALRNRADKADLIERVLDGEAAELGIDARLSPDAAAALARYGWPGNIRQLRLVLRAPIVASTGGLVTGAELPPAIARSGKGATEEERPADAAPGRFAEASSPEADALLHTLRENAWRIADTARALGLSRQAVYRRMDRFRIVPPNRADAGNVLR
jgi:transcriptional regulator of acetoin/glycerol metabolism